MAFSPRYFEIQPGGHSTLERHEHAHWVLILRGQGHVLLGDQLIKINPYDTLTIPPMTWHQFQPIGAEPFGFLCVVNQERDRPQLPTEADLKLLCKDKKIQRWIRA
jgi:mannose-6-phosphate isomerase-like protein (cupin superfamily)